jgi:hypothetical protein
LHLQFLPFRLKCGHAVGSVRLFPELFHLTIKLYLEVVEYEIDGGQG